ncbi:MAG: carbohydrate-binding domain-containing protein, partial [Oscillospiraceae bacterium]|nr:carbohydrate-binding domain-containing protein [Oscillospiraceae bacterium]
MRKVLFVILVFCLLIDCAISGAANSTGALASSASYTWDEASATKITFTQDAAQVQGSGASAAGAVVTISGAGTYVLSGECADGRVVVDAGKNDTVQLVLNNVTLTCKTTSPIYAKKADTVVLILADGSVNTISDTAGYVFEEGTDEPDATVFVKNNLIISGNGSLTVNGNYRNAIAAKDDLTIYGGNISVTAINDGLRGRDSVTIFDGAITVAAGNDGIKSNNDEDAAKGFIILNGGAFDIKAGRDGIQAETSLTINGGTYTIVTGGGSANAPTRTEEFRGGGWNGGTFVMPQQPPQAGLPIQPAQTESAAETDDSMKALKCGTALTISGGDFTIDAEDDAVHSNADVSVTGGVFEIQSGDDGFHADSALRIDGGDINIAKAYEGLEG